MPDGKTHFKIWKLGWTAIVPASILLISAKEYALTSGLLMGYALGAYIDPDLDVMGTNDAEGRMVNTIPILGPIVYGYSSIYGAIFRRHHRSIITHFPIISTAIRLFFFFWWVYFLYMNKFLIFDYNHLYFYLAVLCGLSLADSLHFAADIIFSDIKKSNGKRNRRK